MIKRWFKVVCKVGDHKHGASFPCVLMFARYALYLVIYFIVSMFCLLFQNHMSTMHISDCL